MQHMHSSPAMAWAFFGTFARARHGVTWLLFFTCVMQYAQPKVPLQEKLALLEFKSAMDVPGQLAFLSNWLPDTDPCDDNWQGVVCNCLTAAFSGDAENDCALIQNEPHVFGVWLQRKSRGSTLPALTGPIPRSWSNLTELRSIGLSNQRITNVDVVWGLGSLEGLTLSGNGLKGDLASINITGVPYLQYAFLVDNQLEGTIPPSWCERRLQPMVIDIRNNSGLCGLEDTCFRSIKNSTVYTNGDIVVSADNDDPSYCCNIQRPACTTDGACRVMTPPYWTNETQLKFNFTNFDNPSNATLVYTTYIYQVLNNDVCRLELTESNLTQQLSNPATVEYPNGITELTYRLSSNIAASGNTYEVGVRASILDCPNRAKWAENNTGMMKATFKVPTIAEVFNTADFRQEPFQTSTDSIGISWTTVMDPDGVTCCNMSMQVVQRNTTNTDNTITTFITVTDVIPIPPESAQRRSFTYTNVSLIPNQEYIVLLIAVNAADQLGFRPTFLTVGFASSETLSPGIIALIVLLSLLLVALVGGLVWLLVMRQREQARQMREKRRKVQLAKFRNFIRTITLQEVHGSLDLVNPSHVAFVITDLENSTACAAVDRRAYRDVQLVHDQIMREHIAKYGGYEVNTEGDSFQVAFPTVGSAVQWCMEVQRALLESTWPRRVTRLPSCSRQVDAQGRVTFNGPRVRMGVHWASAGTFIIAEHPETELKVFKGRGWELAHEVGDMGWGGQVLLTEHAWQACQHNMSLAGFPIVQQVGLFKLKHWLQPMWLYEVRELLGRPIGRHFPPLPKHTPLVSATRTNLVLPPMGSLMHIQGGAVDRMSLLPSCKNINMDVDEDGDEDEDDTTTSTQHHQQQHGITRSDDSTSSDVLVVDNNDNDDDNKSDDDETKGNGGVEVPSTKRVRVSTTLSSSNHNPSSKHIISTSSRPNTAPGVSVEGVSVRSFIRGAAGNASLKQRLEALRHRAHTGRWEDALLHVDGELTFVVARLEPWVEHLEASPQHHKSTSADMWEVLDDQVILTNTNDEWGGDGGQEGVEGSQGGRGGGGQGGGGGGVFGGKGVRSLSISRSSSVSKRSGGVGGVVRGSDGVDSLPYALVKHIRHVMIVMAQEFGGYIFRQIMREELVFGIVFSHPLDAVRFCHGVQHLMMLHTWPSAFTHVFGPRQEAADGMPVFYGPRFAMVVHRSNEYMCHSVGKPIMHQGQVVWPQDLVYTGAGPSLTRRLSRVAHGGQVVVTSVVWRSIQDHVPPQVEVLDCGTYVVPDILPPQSLYQLLPSTLSARVFDDLKGCTLLSKGYIHSPSHESPVAICFAKVDRPAVVEQAFAADLGATSEAIVDSLTAYYSGVTLLEQVLRELLGAFDGYECKSPEPGKFTLAFDNLELAVRYCCAVQLQLLDLPWPSTVLEWPECIPQYSTNGRLLFRGLRLRMGLTWGRADSRKPLNTGHADYFGSVANMAARIMMIARPGQILVQGTTDLLTIGQTLPPEIAQSLLQQQHAAWSGVESNVNHPKGSGGSMLIALIRSEVAPRMGSGGLVLKGHGAHGRSATHRITDSGGVVANGSGSGKGPLPHDGVTMISDSPVLSHVASVTGTARCLGPSPMAEESLVLLPLGKYKLKGFPDDQVLFLITPVALSQRVFPDLPSPLPWSLRDIRAPSAKHTDASTRGLRRLKNLLTVKRTSPSAHSGSGGGSISSQSNTENTSTSKHNNSSSQRADPTPAPPVQTTPSPAASGGSPGASGGPWSPPMSPAKSCADLAAMLSLSGTQMRTKYAPLSKEQIAAARQVAELYVMGRDGSTISLDRPTVENDSRMTGRRNVDHSENRRY